MQCQICTIDLQGSGVFIKINDKPARICRVCANKFLLEIEGRVAVDISESKDVI